MPETIIEKPDRWTRFTEWLEANDEHAQYHLGLLSEIASALSCQERLDVEKQRALADKLERWRYQVLDTRPGQLPSVDQELADELDTLANRLAGRPMRLVRAPRQALDGSSDENENQDKDKNKNKNGFDAIAGGLDASSAASLVSCGATQDELVRRARELTATWFSVSAGRRSHAASPAHSAWDSGRHPHACGRQMVLYAPLYLSSYCVNYCTYCGFRYPQKIDRQHLSGSQALRQAEILASRGFRHLLLVAGDFPKLTSTRYFADIIRTLNKDGLTIAVEIAPQTTSGYAQLVDAGACGVTLYQETYDERLYARYHTRGTKGSFDWRLEGHERAAEAGMSRLGMGVLLGLADPRGDLVALIRHGRYLQARFPEVQLSFGLPRIHQAPREFSVPHPVDDETFVRLYCILRLAFPQAHLVLSTREPEPLRDRLAEICITQMSAGSSTAPGGYEANHPDQSGRQQFPVTDHRSAAEVASWLQDHGFEVRWDV